ncbi:MAG: pantetheine-phosphate adenylyltransferase [Thermotogota bacterium]|nr:pantetheine-phosphate adenylyltransferase [Thermotogota bacterium]
MKKKASDSMEAVYPGSFDPITYGHIDIIERSAEIFEKIIVLVTYNVRKTYSFSFKERTEMAKDSLKDFKNVEVVSYDGLLVDFLNQNSIKVVIRGLRVISDFEHELQMAHANKALYNTMETFFLMTDNEYSYISSSMVKEIVQFGGDVSSWVPEKVAAKLMELYKKN